MPDDGPGFDIDVGFPWEAVLTQGLALLRDELRELPTRSRQYFAFWWVYDFWKIRHGIDEQSAGPPPKFEDFQEAGP